MASSSSSLSMFFLMTMISLSSLPFYSLVGGDEALIEKTCKATIDPDFCISTIKSDSSSSTSNTKDLVGILIKKAQGNATDAAAFIMNPFRGAKELCNNYYVSARQSLDESLKDLEANEFDSAGRKSSEARESTKTCATDFGRFGVTYPVELGTKEEHFEKLCDIASSIISKLSV